MTYVIICIIIIAVIVAILYYWNKVSAKKRLEKIRSQWGRVKDEEYDFDNIAKYLIVDDHGSFHQLTAQTIEDVDFYRLFAFVDRTSSRVGQQFLFKKMFQPSDIINYKVEEFSNIFRNNSALREEIQIELTKVSGNNAYHISSLLKKLIQPPGWLKWTNVSLSVLVILLIFAFKFPGCLIFALVPAVINMFVHYWNKNNSFQFSRSIPQLNILINVAENLQKQNPIFSNKSVVESVATFTVFKRRIRLLSLLDSGTMRDELSQIGTYFIELIKAFFLVEVFTLLRVLRELESKKENIRMLFDYVGEIDCGISIASLRDGELKTCKPVFINCIKEFLVVNLCHPLIRDCANNDLKIKGKSVLITGSNMSGKTTFLRTIAVNSILAQSINTCFADEFKTPVLKQFSSIRIKDDLFEGKSYYIQEVNTMRSLIEAADLPCQNLFLLDEVFKGTNTVERIAAAKAILSYLNKGNNIVIVSTHDIELASLLGNKYDLYHFTEMIENDELLFDHKIKPGELKTRNAIKILELSQYPKEIIDEARKLS